jgi:hypothetical protein
MEYLIEGALLPEVNSSDPGGKESSGSTIIEQSSKPSHKRKKHDKYQTR